MRAEAVRKLTAGDIMTSDVVCLNEDLDLHECERILIDRGISGAPVVDLEGHLVGVVSKTDLVAHHYVSSEEEAGGSPPYRVEQGRGSRVIEFAAPCARDLMTPVPCVATEGATIAELAALMARREVHRVVICRNRRVTGIVTTMDILRALAADEQEDWDPSGFPG